MRTERAIRPAKRLKVLSGLILIAEDRVREIDRHDGKSLYLPPSYHGPGYYVKYISAQIYDASGVKLMASLS